MSQSHNGPAANTRSKHAAVALRLEKLPTELIGRIAEQLDTKSLKQLRLCYKRLDAASSHAFAPLLACVPFWFMKSSMQRLVLLSESSRWSKHVKTLAIMSSCPEVGKCPTMALPYPPRWTVNSPQLRHYGLHLRNTHPNPIHAESETRFGVMPNVHTLVIYLTKAYQGDIAQHRLLPALYSALPNLTTLQILKMDTALVNGSQPRTLAQYVPRPTSALPHLLCLGIKNCALGTIQEVIDMVRTYRDTLRSIEICKTQILRAVDLLRVLQLELPHLENIVFEDNTENALTYIWFRWADGKDDGGHHAQRMVEEKGVGQTLREMIAGFHLISN